ncbi:MAG: hypothetical protein AABW46_02365 [Nanoarchaeota archaeon]
MKPNLVLGVLIAFFLNLFWEISHSLLYNWNNLPLQNNIYYYIPKILWASLVDAFYVFVILLLLIWSKKIKNKDYVITFSVGLFIAFVIEIRALYLELWSYNQYMPTFFGIGVTPLLQLATTGVITLYILKKIYKFSN